MNIIFSGKLFRIQEKDKLIQARNNWSSSPLFLWFYVGTYTALYAHSDG